MWVRKTAEEIEATLRTENRRWLSPAFTRTIAILCIFSSVLLSFLNLPASVLFLVLIYLLACLCAELGILFRNPTPVLFCPTCKAAQAYAETCMRCENTLEPFTNWKWVKKTVSHGQRFTPAPSALPGPGARPAGCPSEGAREIPLSLPTTRTKLAALIGINQSQLLKDLVDQDLGAAVNPRLSDREILTNLARKYRIAFKFES